MSQIKISVPNDDHVALRAMAKALEEIAVARGAPAQNVRLENHIHISQDESGLKQRVTEAMQKAESDEAVYLSSEEAEAKMDAFKEEIREKYDPAVFQVPTTDSTDTPWDERIHSASKALNSDGTWRVRRKPKDMDEAEWTATIQNVQDELLGQKPESDDTVQIGNPDDPEAPLAEEWDGQGENTPEPARIEPTVTPAGDDFHVDAGVVTEQEVAAIPAPPLPVPPVPPVAPQEDTDSYTFPQVMKFLTERHARISSTQVEQIIREMGLSSIMDLNTQPEHTGPFIARVKALLGE